MRSDWTPLHQAAYVADAERVAALLPATADVDARDERGRTPLHYAAIARSDDREAETAAVIVSALIQTGANVNAAGDDGDTPVFGVGSPEVVSALIQAGADVNARNKWASTPLHYAVGRSAGSLPVLALLIQAGAEVDARDDEGRTPLAWAAEQGRTLAVDALIKARTDVNARSWDGSTPLHMAVAALGSVQEFDGISRTVAALVRAGAAVDARDSKSRTPLDLVKSESNVAAVIAALVEAGAL